jgi:hypothetical protein
MITLLDNNHGLSKKKSTINPAKLIKKTIKALSFAKKNNMEPKTGKQPMVTLAYSNHGLSTKIKSSHSAQQILQQREDHQSTELYQKKKLRIKDKSRREIEREKLTNDTTKIALLRLQEKETCTIAEDVAAIYRDSLSKRIIFINIGFFFSLVNS